MPKWPNVTIDLSVDFGLLKSVTVCKSIGAACQNQKRCKFSSRNTAIRNIMNDDDLEMLTAH